MPSTTDRSAARAARLTAAVQASTNPEPGDAVAPEAPAKVKAKRRTTASKSTPSAAAPSSRGTRSRGTRPGGPPPGTAWLPTYLPRELHEVMRDAYVWELDNTDDPTTSLPRWIGRAVLAHAARTPQERAELDKARPDAQVAGLDGHLVRAYTVPQEALDALADVETKDRAAGFSTVRNRTVATAIWAAMEATKAQAGGMLPHYEGRLPSKPNPARRA